LTSLLSNLLKILYVTGLLLNARSAAQVFQPLTQPVLFLKESDFLLLSDVWRVVLNLDLSTYHEVISIVESDLLIEQQKQAYTPISELDQIKNLLRTMDSKLNYLYHILPHLDPRQSLVNLEGTVLRTLFGTATIADLNLLHEKVSDLQIKNSDLARSVSNQLTYVKDMSITSKVNADGIANLSSILKEKIIESHDRFQEIASDMLWINISLFGQSTLYKHIRQLEFTLLQLTQQIHQLFNSVQCANHGKLSVEFVTPKVLQSILRNISLHLPESYELVAGTSVENIHLYYELTNVTEIANSHFIYLVLNVPLRTTNSHFNLLRIINLPVRVTSDKFVQYSVYFAYFGLQRSQQSYLLFSEADFGRCNKGSIISCPADVAIYDAPTYTCESILFFKTGSTDPLYRQKLLFHHSAPSLQRYRKLCLYHFPNRHQLSLRCKKANNQIPHTLNLGGSGLVHNLSGCHITSPELQAFPELQGTTDTNIDPPKIFLPDNISVLNDHELQQLKDISPPNLQGINDVYTRVTESSHTFNLDSFIQANQSLLYRKRQMNWFIIPLISYAIFSTILILSYFFTTVSKTPTA
jgi:hypothetical protein